MDTLHFSALPTDQLPATVLPEQTYQIPADAPANATCGICCSSSPCLLDRNRFDFVQRAVLSNQKHLLAFKGLVTGK